MGTGTEVRRGAERYRFDGVVVDAVAHTLVRDGSIQQVEPKAFAVLLELLRHPGELVDRDHLIDAVWGHRHVTPGVLTRAIAQLRTALNDNALHPKYIQTQHALGYRFIGELVAEPDTASDAEGGTQAVAQAPSGAHPSGDTASAPRPMPYAGTERRRDLKPGVRTWLAILALLALVAGWTALQRLAAPSSVPASPSIAVLPFTTLGDDKRESYFAEGLALEILSALASEPGLIVAAWQSPESVDRNIDARSLGRKLGVANLLDASVRREGRRLRIDARLTDAAKGTTRWSRSFDGDIDAVFDTQRRIARETVNALQVVLPDDGTGLDRRLAPTRDSAAFDAYLLGISQVASAGGNRQAAAESFRRALARDAGFARAQAGLCRIEVWGFENSRDPAALERAKFACQRAENMDRGVGEVALALGDLYRTLGEHDRAMDYYERAAQDRSLLSKALFGQARIDLERRSPEAAMEKMRLALEATPGDAKTYAQLGYVQSLSGRPQDAVASFRNAIDLNPGSGEYWRHYGGALQAIEDEAGSREALLRSIELELNDSALSRLGVHYYRRGDYRTAASFYHRASELTPTSFRFKGNLGDALLADEETSGQARQAYSEAASLARESLRLRPDDAVVMARLGWYLVNTGQTAEALDLVARSEEIDRKEAYVAYFNAMTLATLGRREAARERIGRAREDGFAEIDIAANAVFRRHGLAGKHGNESTSRQ